MSAVLQVEVEEFPSDTIVHRFRSFGEAVYLALRDTTTVSLEEIDRSTTSFLVRDVRAREVRTVSRAILALAKQHGFEATAAVRRV